MPVNSRIPQALRSVRFTPSAVLLVAANLLPIYGVLALHWSLFPVLLLFWLETVVVGAMSFLKILFAYPTSFSIWVAKIFFFPFSVLLLIPYVTLVAGLGMIVVVVFGSEIFKHGAASALSSADGANWHLTLEEAIRLFRGELDAGILLSVAGLAASHLFSFILYYLVKGECNRASLGQLVIQPIARVWLSSMALTVGMFGVQRLDAPLWLLAPLLGVKAAIDLDAHLREHRQTAEAAAPGTPLPPKSGPQGEST